MKLLIITQKVNENDPILGFFHRWIEEFAKYFPSIIVICLQKGEYHLPVNVRVLSLGKETGQSRAKYLWWFYRYIFRERKNYDAVFVHMNQEYVLLAGLLWRLWGKKVFMWRNHARGSLLTRVAILLAHKVFFTSSHSYSAKFSKGRIMPIGIDTDFFKPNPSVPRKPNSILFLGRIAPVKNVHLFVGVLNELKKMGVEFSATIAGVVLLKDVEYERIVRKKAVEYGLNDKISFVGSITRIEALQFFEEHYLYVNLTPLGSMDKTIYEAMACDITPLVFNQDLKSVLGSELTIQELNVRNIAIKISKILALEDKNHYRDFAIKKHSLESLVKQLIKEIKQDDKR